MDNPTPHLHPTQKHYDQQVNFFRLFLDPYLKYSAGLWLDKSNDLAAAQLNMLDKFIDFIPDLSQAAILDIGSGWGSFLKRCIERNHGQLPREYVAINPAGEQAAYMHDHIHPDVTILQSGFEELDITPLEDRFDVIVYLGSFSHMTGIDEVMKKLNRCLTPKGKIIIEDTLFLSEAHYKHFNDHPQTTFIQKEVFGVAPIPSFPALIEMSANAGLGLEYVLEHSDSYKKTLAAWIQRMVDNFDKVDSAGQRSFKENIRYMELVQRGWGYTIGNYLMVFRKYKETPNFVRTKKLSTEIKAQNNEVEMA